MLVKSAFSAHRIMLHYTTRTQVTCLAIKKLQGARPEYSLKCLNITVLCYLAQKPFKVAAAFIYLFCFVALCALF
jgi:hypothetical protein